MLALSKVMVVLVDLIQVQEHQAVTPLMPTTQTKRLLLTTYLLDIFKVVVAVHLCGQPCDMQAIHALGQRYGFRIIEDASHAIGGKYQGDYIGSGRYSDITVFSFHPVKIITTVPQTKAQYSAFSSNVA